MRNRATLLRFAFAAFGMLFLCCTACVGLGWAVWTHASWFHQKIGEKRFYRLHGMYARALGSLSSKDGDGDGFSDWVEAWQRTNPLDPASYPDFDLQLDDARGFHASVWRKTDDEPNGLPADLLLGPEERRRVRMRMRVYDQKCVVVAGMQMILIPSPSGLVALPGATPSAEPLKVPVSADGTLEFDVIVHPDAANPIYLGAFENIRIEKPVASPSSNLRRRLRLFSQNTVDFVVARRHQPLECSVTDAGLYLEKQGAMGYFSTTVRGRLFQLSWGAPPDSTEMLAVEATSDREGQTWYPVALFDSKRRSATIAVSAAKTWIDEGTVRFRVTPLRSK